MVVVGVEVDFRRVAVYLALGILAAGYDLKYSSSRAARYGSKSGSSHSFMKSYRGESKTDR